MNNDEAKFLVAVTNYINQYDDSDASRILPKFAVVDMVSKLLEIIHQRDIRINNLEAQL